MTKSRVFLIACVLAIAAGVVLAVLQFTTTHDRDGDYLSATGDGTGSALGWFGFVLAALGALGLASRLPRHTKNPTQRDS